MKTAYQRCEYDNLMIIAGSSDAEYLSVIVRVGKEEVEEEAQKETAGGR